MLVTLALVQMVLALLLAQVLTLLALLVLVPTVLAFELTLMALNSRHYSFTNSI